MVSMQNQSTFNAPMLTSSEHLTDSCATRAAILTGVRRWNFPHSPSSLFRFGREYRKESAPCRVTNTFGEMMILDHPANVQRFNRDVVKLSDELQADFVQEVEPLPLNSQMLLCQKVRCFTAVLTASFPSADATLRDLQPSFSLTQMLRVGDSHARRERGEALKANVQTDTRARLRNIAAKVTFDAEANVPTVNLLFERHGLNRALYGTRETHATTADFRERQLVAFKFPSRLRKGERMIAIFVPETWIACFFTFFDPSEKGVKAFLYALQSILQDLTVDGGDIGTRFFDVRQLVGLGLVVERDAGRLVSIAPLLQRGVVQLMAHVEGGGQLLVHRPRDPQLVLECLSHGQSIAQSSRRRLERAA